MERNKNVRCESCRHWDCCNANSGICRRYPPMGGRSQSIIGKDEWCSEHSFIKDVGGRQVTSTDAMRVTQIIEARAKMGRRGSGKANDTSTTTA
jgi:hypothetical protein